MMAQQRQLELQVGNHTQQLQQQPDPLTDTTTRMKAPLPSIQVGNLTQLRPPPREGVLSPTTKRKQLESLFAEEPESNKKSKSTRKQNPTTCSRGRFYPCQCGQRQASRLVSGTVVDESFEATSWSVGLRYP
jgi:hypothetical protein